MDYNVTWLDLTANDDAYGVESGGVISGFRVRRLYADRVELNFLLRGGSMRDWMTIAIAFLGALAVALVTILILQPPANRTSDAEHAPASGDREQPRSAEVKSEKTSSGASKQSSSEDASSGEETDAGTNDGREATARAETGTNNRSGDDWSKEAPSENLPKLVFYSIPT